MATSKRSGLAALAAFVVCSALAPAAHAQNAGAAGDQFAHDYRQNERRILSNQFVTNRRLTSPQGQSYGEWFGKRLADDMATWHEGMRVLDAGAGSAGMFGELIQNEHYGHTPSYQPRTLPKMLAVSVRRPDRVEGGDRVEYVEGWLGRPDLALERQIGFGTIDRIVDVFGPVHYTENVGKLLEGYAHMLRPGGRVMLVFDHSRTTFENEHGETMHHEDYFKQVPGFRAVAFDDNNRFIAGQTEVTLERTSESPTGQTLETRAFHSGSSATPVRRFRVLPRQTSRPIGGTRVPARSLVGGPNGARMIGGARVPPRSDALHVRGLGGYRSH